MKLQTIFGFFACASLLFACSSNEPSSDGTGASGGDGGSGATGGTGAGGGSGGSSDGGSGGSGGGTGGTGGEGGSPPAGPCDAVPADTLGVVYTAPSPHAEGLVGISAWVECPAGSSAVCTNISWSDPFAGCVAADGVDTVTCLFGTRPADTKVRYIAGLYPSDAAPANAWFSWLVGTEIKKEGTHVVCNGPTVIGGFDGVSFSGALADTDETNKANQMITVPLPE